MNDKAVNYPTILSRCFLPANVSARDKRRPVTCDRGFACVDISTLLPFLTRKSAVCS